MSQSREAFRDLLKTIPGATVYGDMPGNVTMSYPAIQYENDDEFVARADNLPYNITDRYQVTVIEKTPERPIAHLVRQLPMCSFNRKYVADQLHHTVYTIYF
jgi:hypothetical protein